MNYLVSDTLQKAEIDAHCYGDCGKINIGAIFYMGLNWTPCQEVDCPYMEREEKVSDFTLRKLRQSLPDEQEAQNERFNVQAGYATGYHRG